MKFIFGKMIELKRLKYYWNRMKLDKTFSNIINLNFNKTKNSLYFNFIESDRNFFTVIKNLIDKYNRLTNLIILIFLKN